MNSQCSDEDARSSGKAQVKKKRRREEKKRWREEKKRRREGKKRWCEEEKRRREEKRAREENWGEKARRKEVNTNVSLSKLEKGCILDAVMQWWKKKKMKKKTVMKKEKKDGRILPNQFLTAVGWKLQGWSV
jgi:sRNA-binding protein